MFKNWIVQNYSVNGKYAALNCSRMSRTISSAFARTKHRVNGNACSGCVAIADIIRPWRDAIGIFYLGGLAMAAKAGALRPESFSASSCTSGFLCLAASAKV